MFFIYNNKIIIAESDINDKIIDIQYTHYQFNIHVDDKEKSIKKFGSEYLTNKYKNNN